MTIPYICPKCRKGNHKLCSPIFCDCKHQRKLKNPGKPSESIHTVSGGLPTLGKGHK